ncbi:TPA: stage II sporulation protein M [Staphylococcus pseudintermedius]
MKINRNHIIFTLYISFLLLGIAYNYFTNINSFSRVSNDDFFNFKKVLHYIRNNGFVYILLCLGLITYKITTIINIVINGFLLGMYLIPMIQIGGIAFLLHGFPELSALYIGAYIGFSNLNNILSYKMKYFVWFLLGWVLIVIAAIIETYLTPIVF